MSHRVLIVDDHKMLRDGLRAILVRSEEFLIKGEAESAAEAIEQCRNHQYDLILMDISLPDASGIAATIEVLKLQPDAKVVILSMYDDDRSLVRAIRAGAKAYILKKGSDHELIDALRAVSKGGFYLSADCSLRLMHTLQNPDAPPPPSPAAISTLAPRELQVFRLATQGKSNKEVAVTLGLSVETVRTYRKNMMSKLNASNIAELTKLAMEEGLSAEFDSPTPNKITKFMF